VIRKALLAAALLVSACAQAPMADPQADQAAKAFPPPEPGRGALYVYRTGLMGLARPIDVQVVGGRTAQLVSNSYLRLEGPPGPIEVDTRYVEASMKIGVLLPGCELAEVPPEQGQAAVRGSKRVVVQ